MNYVDPNEARSNRNGFVFDRKFPLTPALSPSDGERAGVRGPFVPGGSWSQCAQKVWLRIARPSVFLFILLLSFHLSTRADELADKGKAIFKQNQHAVVTVQIVLKNRMSMAGRSGESSESRQDVTGTVIDPAGFAGFA